MSRKQIVPGLPATLTAACLAGLLWIPAGLAGGAASIEVGDSEVVVDGPGVFQLPFEIQRSGDSTDGIRLELKTAEGGDNPAVPEQDYTPLPAGTEVIIEPGHNGTTVDVEVFGDFLKPDSEATVLLELTGARAFNTTPRLASTGRHYPACCAPMSLAVGDFNGDGHLDLVTGNGDLNSFEFYVGIQLADGQGGFGDMTVFPIENDEVGLVLVDVGDVTANGHLDIVATGFNGQDILIFAGNGDGTFADPAFVSADGRRPWAMVLADVTGNGHLDIATANGGSNSVSVIPADGSGGFDAIGHFPAGDVPASLFVADVTGNGQADIVTANTVSNDISLLLADGAGGFELPQSLPIGPDAIPHDIIVADVTGNGHPDLLTANETPGGLGGTPPGTVSLLEGDGAGDFASPIQLSVGDAPSRLDSIRVADVIGNGHPDIIVSQPTANRITVLIGDKNGGFDETISLPVATGPNDLAIADITGDGNLDIASGNFVDGSISLLPGDGQGGLGFPGNFPVGTGPYRVIAGDFSGNGALDVVTTNVGSDDVSVLVGDGSGGFSAPTSFPAGSTPGWITSDDLNGDGHPDLIVGNGFGSTISLLFGDGAGGFSVPESISIADDFQAPVSIATGDLNGNGHIDIATVNRLDGGVGGGQYLESITVLLADGSGGYADPVEYELSEGGHNNPQGIYLFDVTGNGHLDILTANAANDNLSLLEGDGTGEFAAAVHLSTDLGPVRMAHTDVTGNGHPDIVTLNHLGQSISVLAGDGSGQYAAATNYPIFVPEDVPCSVDPRPCPWPWGMKIGDVTGNGHPDIVTANTEQNTITVMINHGEGNFDTSLDFPTGAHPRDMVVDDFTGNGNVDVLVANNHNHNVSLLANLMSEVVLINDVATGTIIAGSEPGKPVLSLEPGGLDFGAQETGTNSAPLTTTITSTGDADLEIDAIPDPEAPFSRSGGSCPDGTITLAPEASCTMEFTFSPTAEDSFATSLDISSNAGSATLGLTGIGTSGEEPTPVIELVGLVDLGEVVLGESAEAQILLANSGEGVLEVQSVTPPAPPFELSPAVQTNACQDAPFQLAPGESCNWLLAFHPEAEGTYEDSLAIESNALSSPDEVVVTASGIAGEVPEAIAIPVLDTRSLILLVLSMLSLGLITLRSSGSRIG